MPNEIRGAEGPNEVRMPAPMQYGIPAPMQYGIPAHKSPSLHQTAVIPPSRHLPARNWQGIRLGEKYFSVPKILTRFHASHRYAGEWTLFLGGIFR